MDTKPPVEMKSTLLRKSLFELSTLSYLVSLDFYPGHGLKRSRYLSFLIQTTGSDLSYPNPQISATRLKASIWSVKVDLGPVPEEGYSLEMLTAIYNQISA